jgi:hypothetical protein
MIPTARVLLIHLPTGKYFHLLCPPIASQSISRDVPVNLLGLISLPNLYSGREWPRLPFTARIERAHSDRARSASKKGTWPLPLRPFFSILLGLFDRFVDERSVGLCFEAQCDFAFRKIAHAGEFF